MRASGFVKEQLAKENVKAIFDEVAMACLDQGGQPAEEEDEDEDDQEVIEEVDEADKDVQKEQDGEEGKDENADDDSSSEEIEENPNRKVRFAETFE